MTRIHISDAAASRRHRRLDDLVGVLHRLAALDLVDVLHAFGDLAPDRVLVVEERGVVEADEELAVAGIRARAFSAPRNDSGRFARLH